LREDDATDVIFGKFDERVIFYQKGGFAALLSLASIGPRDFRRGGKQKGWKKWI